jgi:hypothetical protein
MPAPSVPSDARPGTLRELVAGVGGRSRFSLTRELCGCAARACRLLAARRLHVDRTWAATTVTLPDGRTFRTFRQTSCDVPEPDGAEHVVLVVWFRLHGVPPRARVRRWLFERESILNTVLYAGMPGFRTKLWMVDPVTSDYAGVYEWSGQKAAETYVRYITSVLRPLSRRDTVGGHVVTGVGSLDEYLVGDTGVAPG